MSVLYTSFVSCMTILCVELFMWVAYRHDTADDATFAEFLSLQADFIYDGLEDLWKLRKDLW